jgi:hypothetical protein
MRFVQFLFFKHALEQFTENISAVIEECVKKLVREET